MNIACLDKYLQLRVLNEHGMEIGKYSFERLRGQFDPKEFHQIVGNYIRTICKGFDVEQLVHI